jgi:hypothetical protein
LADGDTFFEMEMPSPEILVDEAALYHRTIFDMARHREPQHYGLIVERKGPIPPGEEN